MPVSTDYISIGHVTVKAGGQEPPDAAAQQLVAFEVDSNLHLPSMAVLKYLDDDMSTLSGGTFDVGKTLEVSISPAEGGQAGVLFKGEITSLEPEFTEFGYAVLVVRGYDKSHRLHRGRKTKVFANQTDSAIVQSIVSAAGLSASVDSTSAQHEHVWQNNQTDWEFVRSRAELLGYQLYVDGQTLYFKKYVSSGSPIELEWQMNLKSFRPRLSATQPVNEVAFQAWDPKQKKAVVGKKTGASSTSNQGGVSDDGGAFSKSKFGAAKLLVTSNLALAQAEAETMAQALYDERHEEFVQAEGVCVGDPRIKAGTLVKVSGVGAKFSGNYRVTSATHVFTADAGYETRFSIHGRQPNTLADLLAPRGWHDKDATGLASVSGVVPALVTNNTDPDGLGRVKVKFPWLDEQLESGWARSAVLGGGPQRGIYFIPEVDDEVLLAFEDGDLNRPYVLGGLWNGKDAPPKKSDQVVADGKVNERIIKSRAGHIIILNDKQGEESITIRDKTEKNEIVISSKDNTISVKTEDKLTIEAKGVVSVKSTSGDLTFEGANVSLKAKSGDVKIEGMNCNIAATANCEIKANASCTVQGTAGLTLKGAPPAQIALTGTVSINNGALDVM